MKTTQFSEFKKDVRKIFGESLIWEVGPTQWQYAFCTSKPDLGESAKAEHIDAIARAKLKYDSLAGCPVMPVGVSGRIVYVIASV